MQVGFIFYYLGLLIVIINFNYIIYTQFLHAYTDHPTFYLCGACMESNHSGNPYKQPFTGSCAPLQHQGWAPGVHSSCRAVRTGASPQASSPRSKPEKGLGFLAALCCWRWLETPASQGILAQMVPPGTLGRSQAGLTHHHLPSVGSGGQCPLGTP